MATQHSTRITGLDRPRRRARRGDTPIHQVLKSVAEKQKNYKDARPSARTCAITIAGCRVDVLKDLFFDRISCINVIKAKKSAVLGKLPLSDTHFEEVDAALERHIVQFQIGLMERMRQTRTQGQEQVYRGSMERKRN